MTRKRPFKFDFNEDAEPVEELHRLRVAATKHFKTLDAILEYHRSTPPIKELIAELDMEIAAKKAKPARSRKTKSIGKPARRQKASKRPIPAG